MEHIKRAKILSNKQYGFVGGRSTILQLLKVLDDWTKILDDGGEVDVIYMDFMKAFDMVPHRRLLKKLECYGVHGKLLNWLKEFLNKRKQRVVVNGCKSDGKMY